MRTARAALILIGLLGFGFALGAVVHRHGRKPVLSAPALRTPPPSTSRSAVSSSPMAGGTARERTSLAAVIQGFTLDYADYLDGGPTGHLTRYGTVTAAAQATSDGRIPVAFRDGTLRIASRNAFARTCCSAQETIVLANRSESYPLTVELLYEQDRWQVTGLTPADLSIDRHIAKPIAVHTPPGAAAAARAFAVAYTRYRAREARLPPALTGAAQAAIDQGTDSLAGQRLPNGVVRLLAIAYGPPSGSEFAATATVTDGVSKQTFSFLMVHRTNGWVCGAFL